MPDFIVSGLLMGLLLSIAAGPTMLALIQSSIAEGAKRTLFMELGVLISDAFLIAVTYFGLGQFLTVSPQLEPLYLSLGGALLIGMGAFKLKTQPTSASTPLDGRPKKSSTYAHVERVYVQFCKSLGAAVLDWKRYAYYSSIRTKFH
jgi:threonine/homoserine/homoserine lactone efflux protein